MEGTNHTGLEGTVPINLINTEGTNHTGLEGTVPINLINMEGTRPPTGASPTQPYKCGQNVKVKTAERGG